MCLKRVLLSIIDNKINFIQQSRGTLLGNKLLCLGPRFEAFEGRCSGFILLRKIPHKMSLLDSFLKNAKIMSRCKEIAKLMNKDYQNERTF